METSGSAVAEAAAQEAVQRAAALAEQADFPLPYLRRVRASTAALGVLDPADAGVRHAALLLDQQAVIDVDVPVLASTRPRRLVKTAIKRVVGWYLRVLGDQVSVLGRSTARLGLAMADSVERLDAEQAALRSETEAELRRLRARVAELEKAAATPVAAGGGAGAPADAAMTRQANSHQSGADRH